MNGGEKFSSTDQVQSGQKVTRILENYNMNKKITIVEERKRERKIISI